VTFRILQFDDAGDIVPSEGPGRRSEATEPALRRAPPTTDADPRGDDAASTDSSDEVALMAACVGAPASGAADGARAETPNTATPITTAKPAHATATTVGRCLGIPAGRKGSLSRLSGFGVAAARALPARGDEDSHRCGISSAISVRGDVGTTGDTRSHTVAATGSDWAPFDRGWPEALGDHSSTRVAGMDLAPCVLMATVRPDSAVRSVRTGRRPAVPSRASRDPEEGSWPVIATKA
jgi:hypothetical protein